MTRKLCPSARNPHSLGTRGILSSISAWRNFISCATPKRCPSYDNAERVHRQRRGSRPKPTTITIRTVLSGIGLPFGAAEGMRALERALRALRSPSAGPPGQGRPRGPHFPAIKPVPKGGAVAPARPRRCCTNITVLQNTNVCVGGWNFFCTKILGLK